MRISVISFISLTFLVVQGFPNSADEILQETIRKLRKMEMVECNVRYENYNPFTGELGKHDSATAYYKFTSTDTIIGAKYLFKSRRYNIGYNGITSFYSDKENKKVVYQKVNNYGDLIGRSFLTFSIPWLRNIIPKVLNDKSIAIVKLGDIKINNADCFHFRISMKGKGIGKHGQIVKIESSADRNYTLIVDKVNFLPRQFVQLYSDGSSPVWKITYENFSHHNTMSNSIFNHLEQDIDFIVLTQEESRAIEKQTKIKKAESIKGTKAANWILPQLKGDSVQLSSLETNLVLLEFWFPYCGGCVKAIPDINEIQETYKNRGLKVFGIEYTKSDSSNLGGYISKWKIEYPTLYLGREVAKKYQVKGGPTIFLINREGNIVYTSFGFNKGKLIDAINENI